MKNFLSALILTCAVSAQAQEALKLKVDLVEINPTEKVYNFITENFVGIIGWQFKLTFDGTKMKYKEIRNPIHPSQTSGIFYEPNPGELRSVWLDPDLVADNYPDSTVLFQLVFEILETEGAPVCFLQTDGSFEFILDEGSGTFTLAEILISDDCYTGFSIILDPTATENPTLPAVHLIKDMSLSPEGTLAFTSDHEQQLTISLYDMTGHQISSFAKKEYTEGRNTLECKAMVPGVYVLRAVAEDGLEQAVKVFAY